MVAGRALLWHSVVVCEDSIQMAARSPGGMLSCLGKRFQPHAISFGYFISEAGETEGERRKTLKNPAVAYRNRQLRCCRVTSDVRKGQFRA